VTSATLMASDYPNIRRTLFDLHEKILKWVSRSDMTAVGQQLGLLRGKVLVFQNEVESQMLFDYLVYAHRPNGINMAELYLRTNRQRLDVLQIDLLERMSQCLFLYVKTLSVDPGSSLHVVDMIQNSPFTLVDQSLSTTSEPESTYAAHFLNLGSFFIQTGAIVGVDWRLINAKELSPAWALWERNRRYDSKLSTKLARATLTVAIRLGYTAYVRAVPIDDNE